MITAEEVAGKVERLPAFSVSVANLLRKLSDPKATASEVEAIMQPDPTLTVKLLKLANSSYYRAAGRIVTVRDAVVRLGTQQLFALAASSALSQLLPPVLPGYQVTSWAFLEHSLGVAVFSQRIARTYAPEVEPVAFTGGLLHDLGKLVLGVFLSQQQSSLLEQLDGNSLSLLETERALLGTDHGEVGLAVCERWKLPAVIGMAARFHHAPDDAPGGEANRLCEVVHVADGMAHLFGLSNDVGGLNRRLDTKVLRSLGVRPGELEVIAAQAISEVSAMTEMMTTEGNPAPTLKAV